ncbi:MAG: FtsL-like putative cell division protein [Bacteroidota bacterium]
MRQNILNILKGKFLVSDDAVKNWRFIFFVSLLAVVMIASSHSADKKVFEIDRINREVMKLRSEFVAVRATVQQMRLESAVTARMEEKGMQPSAVPPKKIKVLHQE